MNPFRHVIPHFRAQWRLFALGIAALLVTNVFEQALPLLLKRAIDAIQAGFQNQLAFELALRQVLLWVAIRVGVVVILGLLRYGWRYGFYGMGRQVEYGMRRELFEKWLSLPPSYYLKHRLGDLLSRAMSDLPTLRETLGNGWLMLFDSFSSLGFSLILMLRLDWRLTLLSFIPILPLPFIVSTVGRRLRQLSFRYQEALDELSQTATESFRGARVIQAYAVAGAEAKRFQKESMAYRDKNMDSVRLEAWYWPLLSVLSGMSSICLFYFGAQHIVETHGAYTGTFVALVAYQHLVLIPVMSFGWITNSYVRGRVSVDRLNEVFDEPSEIESGAKQGSPTAGPFLEFRAVSFSYPGAAPSLRHCSLSLSRGEWLGLAGRTGAGKSTLLSMPPRLKDPQEGELIFEGLELRQWKLGALRRRVAIVMQEPFLFSATILENLALAAETADLEEARRWAKVADLDDFIMSLPDAYASMLGEKGVNLSGGQKQRLALARALYVRPTLLLLDDAFSAVDTATEARIVERLHESLPETSVMLVSHRSSTLRLCGRIAVMEQGTIVEEGSHEALTQKEGYYFEILRREQLARQSGLESL